VATLEIVRVEGKGLWAKLFPLYFRYVTPWMGALLAGDREAYTYLPESVQGFLSARELAAIMEDVGLRNVAFRPLALGTVAIHVGEKG
jgi:demethylmenaquinone methyltransferase/2-methoxy-6-polyprenyl-1,4-benzoquinol methylase